MVTMIRTMTQAKHSDHDSCTACGGRGWKFLTMRRSALRAADAGEQERPRRQRVECLSCQGTGKRQHVHAGNGAQDRSPEQP